MKSIGISEMQILKYSYSSRAAIRKKSLRSAVQYFAPGVDKTEFQWSFIVSMLQTGVLRSPL